MSTGPSKPALRRELRALRRALDPDARAEADRRIGALCLAHLLALGVGPGHRVALFASLPHEATPLGLHQALRSRAVELAYPRVTPDGLVLHLSDTLDALTPGFAGIPEPDQNAPSIPLDGRLRAVLVPGLAFTLAGQRLGQGGGYYDRLLAQLTPDTLPLGIAYALQVLPALPTDPHDQRVAAVVTDAGVLHASGLSDPA